MTVRENVAYGLRVKGVGRRERARARRRGARAGAARASSATRKPIQLSGRPAPARRARARARQPPARAPARRAARRARPEAAPGDADRAQAHPARASGITFIYVTHDQDEALTMSDRIAVFNEGRIEQVGTPGEIYEHPANEFVAGFVGDVERDRARRRRFTVRPEKIHMLTDGAEGRAVRKARPGRCARSSTSASVTRYVVELDDGGRARSRSARTWRRRRGRRSSERGRRVRLAWAPRARLRGGSEPGGGVAMSKSHWSGARAGRRHGRRRLRRQSPSDSSKSSSSGGETANPRRRRRRAPSCRRRSARARASST